MNNERVQQLEQRNQFYGEYTLQKSGSVGLYRVWNQLQIGSELNLGYSEKEKKISVAFPQTGTDNQVIIGYFQLSEEVMGLLRILSSGWVDLADLFECIICSFDASSASDQQIRVGLWIRERVI